MKSIVLGGAAAVLVLAGCAPTPATTPSATPTPTPTATPTATATSSPTPAGPVANAMCGNLSFYLDPALGTGYTCQTVPADPGPMNPHPEMTQITLVGYPQSRSPYSERIYVMSIADWNALDPVLTNDRLSVLQGLLGASAPPPTYGTGGSTWTPPLLPDTGGMPAFFAQYGIVPFADGSGVRFLTELRFDAMPIGNDGVIYTYQGVTSDGQYWVSVYVPIQNTILIADENVLPAGYATWDDFWAGYDAYIVDIVGILNSQPPATFEPLIADLDALVASFTITP